jgi:hypothetical protein
MQYPELRLPKHLLDIAVRSGNEYGWHYADALNVIEAALWLQIAITGGQVQYKLPNGTCELYWLSYDVDERKANEDWIAYCQRAASECIDRINKVIETNIELQALEFQILRDAQNEGIQIDQFKIFILYFDDMETSDQL